MEETITEKKYPIQRIWLLKRALSGIIYFIIIIILMAAIISLPLNMQSNQPPNLAVIIFALSCGLLFILVICFTQFISPMLQRSNFHFSLDEKFLTLHQGVFSKQNRNIPYGVIQDVNISQGLFERIFGLSSLTLEDFSQDGIGTMNSSGYVRSGKTSYEAIGSVGSGIHIPGLKKEDAEALRQILLQKIKDNPIDNNQSGL